MRLHTTELVSGDLITEDIFNHYGLLILSAGTYLTNEEITKLFRHNVEYIEIERKVTDRRTTPAPNSAESLAERFQPLFGEAMDGVEHMFFQAAADGKFDRDNVITFFKPLADKFSEQKDIVSLLMTIEEADSFTYRHSVQVGMISYYLAKWMGKSEEEAVSIGRIGYTHDIGKCRLAPELLTKADLTDSEMETYKQHSRYGYEINEQSGDDPLPALVALQHHERLNGSGYPDGLTSEQIHPISKLVAIADLYSELITPHSGTKPRDLFSVLQELHRLSFGELDAKAVQVFIEHMLPQFVGKQVLLTDGRIGTIVMINASDYFHPLIRFSDGFLDMSASRQVEIAKVFMQD